MRKTIHYMLGLMLLFALSSNSSAQKLETQKSHELSKDARKGELLSFEYDKEAKEYWLVFKREKGKKAIYETYQFDYDFNLIKNETSEERKKGKESGPPEKAWHNPKVIRLGNIAGENAGQIVLKLGTLHREWVTRSVTRGNYIYYESSYEYTFEEEKVVKPKYDPKLDFPDGTPKMIKKMVTGLASKVAPLAYMTDEPQMDVTLGNNKSLSALSVIASGFRKHDFTEASGDVVVAGMQQYPLEEEWICKVKLLKYSAKDLSLTHEENIDFQYPMFKFFSKVMEDKTIALILAPYKAQKGTPDPNPLNYVYLRISDDATLLEKCNFESPCRQWGVVDAVLGPKGGIYFYGLSSTAKNDKYLMNSLPPAKAESIQLVKFKDGKLAYASTSSIDEMSSKVQKPANQKKAEPFEGKGMNLEAGSTLITPGGEVILCGAMHDKSAINYFHYNTDGKFKAQYNIQPEQKLKEAGIDHAIIMNNDGKTVTVFFGELEGENKGRQLKYPRMGTIDLATGTVSEMTNFGYSKKEQYYLDDVYPMVPVDPKRITFFSRDAKDNYIWLGRVALPE